MAVIVIADDDQEVADLATYAFERAGHTVRTVLDGIRALRLIRDLRPDVAVLDHCMPGLTGSQVVAAVRAHPATANTTFVMITARDPAEVTETTDLLLLKPIAPRQLTAVVAELLKRPTS